MIKHVLKIEFEAEEGALLGLIQRRGFTIECVTMPESAGSLKTVHLTLMPLQPAYRIEVLQRQISRLYEVRTVTLVAPKPPHSVLGFLKGPIVSLQKKSLLSKETSACLPENSSHVS